MKDSIVINKRIESGENSKDYVAVYLKDDRAITLKDIYTKTASRRDYLDNGTLSRVERQTIGRREHTNLWPKEKPMVINH